MAGVIAAGLYPLRRSSITSGLGLVLEWCKEPKDLDFWITVPMPEAGGRAFFSCSQQYQEFNEVLGVWETRKRWFNSSSAYNTEDLCQQAGGEWEAVLPWEDDDNAAVYWDGPKHIISACLDDGQPGFDPYCQPGTWRERARFLAWSACASLCFSRAGGTCARAARELTRTTPNCQGETARSWRAWRY